MIKQLATSALLSMSAIVLAASTSALVSADPIANGYQFKVVQHNVAGSYDTAYPGSLGSVNTQIVSFDPDVVTLEEVCQYRAQEFLDNHPGWVGTFTALREKNTGCANNGSTYGPKGQFLATKWTMQNLEILLLGDNETNDINPNVPVDDPKIFKLMCADIVIPNYQADQFRACVTHLRAYDNPEAEQARINQTDKIRDLLQDRVWVQDQSVILAGDFNASPYRDPMNNLYRLRNNGQFSTSNLRMFHEADQTDKSYFDTKDPSTVCGVNACRTGQLSHKNGVGGSYKNKLDYVFFSANRSSGTSGLSALVVDSTTSDHGVLRARSDITATPLNP